MKGILIEVELAGVGEFVGAVFFPPFPASMGGRGDSALFLFPGDAGAAEGDADAAAITGTRPAGMWWVEPGGMVSTPPLCCCGDSALPVVAAMVVCGGIAAMGTGTGIEIVLL